MPPRAVSRTRPRGVPGASRCPVGHTPVERAPRALGPLALRGWAGDWGLPPGGPALGALGLGAPEEASGRGHRPDLSPNGAALRGAKCAFGTRAGARVVPYFGVLGGLWDRIWIAERHWDPTHSVSVRSLPSTALRPIHWPPFDRRLSGGSSKILSQDLFCAFSPFLPIFPRFFPVVPFS